MSLLRHGSWIAFACACVACSIYTEDLLEEGSGGNATTTNGGSGGTAGSGGSGGSGAASSSTTASGGGGGGALKDDGEDCVSPGECFSDLCIDGVCCASMCGGFCEACNVEGGEGVCTAVNDGEDPDDECGADSCNGAGVCRCDDGQLSGMESDSDCGGPACTPCADNLNCNQPSDCQSGVCTGNQCQPPTCSDLVHNGPETDVDCGGGCPNACADGLGCALPADCQSQVCSGNVCQPPICGDNVVSGPEQCDDNNTDDYDGCASSCLNPVQHLLISEFVAAPTDGEFVEIFNPTASSQDLSNVYLADYNTYYLVTTSGTPSTNSDFLLRFPAGTMLPAGGFVVVALDPASDFQTEYAALPDFDVDASDGLAPVMLGDFTGSAGLTNTSEMLVLFRWNGSSDLVEDLDYVAFGSDMIARVDKSGVIVLGSTYLADTAVGAQTAAAIPASGKSQHRCDSGEASEAKSNGNGILGHNETSENGAASWKVLDNPTPGSPPPAGFCP